MTPEVNSRSVSKFQSTFVYKFCVLALVLSMVGWLLLWNSGVSSVAEFLGGIEAYETVSGRLTDPGHIAALLDTDGVRPSAFSRIFATMRKNDEVIYDVPVGSAKLTFPLRLVFRGMQLELKLVPNPVPFSLAFGISCLISAAALYLRRIRKAFRRREKEALQKESEIRFATQFAHDARAPITTIRVALARMKSEESELIRQACTYLLEICESLLKSTRRGQMKVIEEAPLKAEFETMLQAFQARGIHDKNTTFSLLVRCEKRLEVDAHFFFQLKSVIANLVSNAFEARAGEAHKVKLDIIIESNNVDIHVNDNGRGFTSNVTAIERLDLSDDEIHGYGIGLKIVKNFIDCYGGFSEIHSKPLQGTKIYLRAPIKS